MPLWAGGTSWSRPYDRLVTLTSTRNLKRHPGFLLIPSIWCSYARPGSVVARLGTDVARNRAAARAARA